jgi:uncharacterized membrane protein YbhN (UPF0104 family)
MTEPATSAGPARVGLGKRRVIVLAVVEVAVLALIVFRVMPQVGSYSAAADALRTMSGSALVLIGAAVLVYLLWYGLPFVAAAPGLGYRHAQQLNQAAFAIGNGVPGGGAFGLGVQYAMFASWGYPAFGAASAIAAIGVWSLFVTLGLPVLGVLALVVSGRAAGPYVLGAVLGLAALVALLVGFALVMRSEAAAHRVGAWGDALVARLPARFRGKVPSLSAAVVHFRAGITELVRRRWAAITVTQLGVSLAQFVVLYLALRGLEGWDAVGTPLLVVFGGFAVSQLGLLVPVTPGGLGTVDAAMVALLVAFGTAPGVATAAALVWRAASFIPQIVVGVAALALWTRSANRLAAGRAPVESASS